MKTKIDNGKGQIQSLESQIQSLESYDNNIRRIASSVVKIKSDSRDNSMRNLRDSIVQSSHEMNNYILKQSSHEQLTSRAKHPRLVRLLRCFS